MIAKKHAILLCLFLFVTCACTQKTPAPITSLGTLKTASYTVKTRDTLQAIAINFGVTPEKIITLNHLSPPYQLYIGQTLWLSEAQAKKHAMTTYPVRSPAPTTFKRQTITHTSTTRKHPTQYSKNATSKSAIKTPIIKHAPPTKTVSTARKTKKTHVAQHKKTDNKWPWPTTGNIIKTYSLKGKNINKGIDISGTYGQPIYAVNPGKVLYSGPGVLGYGNMLIIEHTNKLLTVYANNKRLLVNEGARIKKGQKIATMGRLASQKAGLHFEIRKNGQPLNPVPYLRSQHA